MAAQQNWIQQQQAHYSHPPPPQMQHSQYPAAWPPNQMPPQGYHNGMAALPFFSPQVLHEALALSHPVERADEPVLLTALVESRSKGETYKEALNRLHGVSFVVHCRHSASLWKDYYLDNKDRLDLATQSHATPSGPKKTVKKPSIGTFKAETSPFSSSAMSMSTSSPAPSKPRRQSSQSSRAPSRAASHTDLPLSGTRRQTINSMTSHMLVYNERIPPPNTELKIPEPPSRSPTPPTEIIPHNRGGHKFTPADREYFIKLIQWRLKGDPTLTRSELCDLLAEKARHHNSQSWAAYWQNHHDLPDKILASVREENEAEESEDEKPKKKKNAAVPRKSKYKEESSESELTEDEEEEEEKSEHEPAADNDDDIEIPPFDESAMGLKGGPFTKGDLGVIARHVASSTAAEFNEFSMQEKWGEIARKYPQRALKSWNEYYRRNQNTIDKLAKKIRKLNEAEAHRRTQTQTQTQTQMQTQPRPAQPLPLPPPPVSLPTPKPIWTAENIGHGPPRAKR
ncbi:hypothetical protein K438DRAFT_1915371, partial [Mycena galopus ATCC 62051]